MEKYSISGLYYRYKRVEDADLKKYLKVVKLVKKTEIGGSNTFAYYPLTPASMKKIREKPRNVSLTFDAEKTMSKPIKGLEPIKDITFLIKSSSRFFLKPDIGEVFDQIDWQELFCGPEFGAICVNLHDYEVLPDTEGEHFLMTATLLRDTVAEKRKATAKQKEAIKQLHQLKV